MGVVCDNNNESTYKDNPYINALSIFTKIKSISKNFSYKYSENKSRLKKSEDIKNMNDFIEDFKNTYNKENDKGDYELKNQMLEKNPLEIFYSFLKKLHLIYKQDNNEDEDNKVKLNAVEYNVSGAKQLFENLYKNDQSEIRDLFYGKKLIRISCNYCGTTHYMFKYLKLIPLDIGKLEYKSEIMELIKSLEKPFSNNSTQCPMCQRKECKITLKLAKKPQILIILIYNMQKRIKIDIPEYLFENSYKLICAEVKINQTFEIFYDNDESILQTSNYDKILNMKTINKGEPIVLFYKRKNGDLDKTIDFSKEFDYGEEVLISREINITEPDQKISSQKKDITLYFNFSNGKEIFLDTDDSRPFSEIIIQLQVKYDWVSSMISQNTHFYVNNKKIDLSKTPRQLKIKNESKIYIQ